MNMNGPKLCASQLIYQLICHFEKSIGVGGPRVVNGCGKNVHVCRAKLPQDTLSSGADFVAGRVDCGGAVVCGGVRWLMSTV